MNKRNKILALSSSCLMLLSLVSCDVTATEKPHVLLEFSDGSVEVTADEVFDRYMNTKDGVEAAYAQINDAVARYTMYNDSDVSVGKRDQLISEAKAKVDDTKTTAENNAKTNKTSYDDELDKLLESNGADDLEELQIIFENQSFRTYLQDKFYEDFIENLKEGGEIAINDTETLKVDSYIDDILPYHVKHILVKVTATASDYTTSTITESEAIKLSNAISKLGNDTQTGFGTIAKNISEDEGSAANFGDLGLMSINTSYVNEFKLGIYAYDTLFNASDYLDNEKSQSKLDKFLLKDDEETATYKEFIKNHGLNFIPSGIAGLLDQFKDVTMDDNNETVNDGKSQYYPRNILWNEYLNKHEISFIEYANMTINNAPVDQVVGATNDDVVSVDTSVDPSLVEDGWIKNTNYKEFQFKNATGALESHYILTDGDRIDPKPILVTRAGTGSGDSGYQGIHFIVVQRSALDDLGSNETTLSDYYSTKLPNINGQIQGLGDKRVYVNAFDTTQKNYQSRVDDLIAEIKEADNSIEKKINEYYFIKSGAEIIDTNLKNKLEIYIDAEQVEADNNSHSDLVAKWKEYYDLLARQADERTSEKLIPLVCAVKFNSASGADKELFEIGGACHYVEQKD